MCSMDETIDEVRQDLRHKIFPPGTTVNRLKGYKDGWRFQSNERVITSIEKSRMDFSRDNIEKALLNESESDYYYWYEKDWGESFE